MGTEGNDRHRLRQLAKLEDLEGDLLEKLAALHKERATILLGGPTMAQRLRLFEQAWRATRKTRYQGDYVFDRKEDAGHMKRLLNSFSMPELGLRMLAFIKSDEPFYVERKHNLRTFVAAINDLSPETPAAQASSGGGPADCKHTPRCTTDEQHTAKRRKDREAVA